MKTPSKPTETQPSHSGYSYEERMRHRLEMGNAWMMCSECGGKLYDFDGHEDASRQCPFKQNGKCEPR